ncbi:MAG TPA: DUF2147 domain-containing protein [Bacteroidales bacterium]|nr:DUF2147 domain-containing protein [Bacteroidales bacterium]
MKPFIFPIFSLTLITFFSFQSIYAQDAQKSHTERSSIGNIIHFFTQPVDYSKDPVHPSQITLPLDTLQENKPVNPEDKILGYIWQSQREAGKTRFEKAEDGTYLARIEWIPVSANDENPKDFRNPDKSLRDRPLLGMIYSSGIVYEEGKWIAPYMYHPNFGITASKGVFFFNKDGELIVRGYKWGFSSTECYKLAEVIR